MMYCYSRILIIAIAQFALLGCSEPNNLERALLLSGNNRPELESVLDHFRNDEFKYNAACFLIENMETKHYYEGWQIDSLKAIKPYGRMNDDQMSEWKWFDYHKHCNRVEHLNVISSRLLIENVDMACDVWKARPWHTSYSFEDFCEYVLPYCIEDEPLEEWRRTYYDKYSPIVDSILLKTTDVVEVAAEVAKVLKNEGFDNHADVTVPHLGALYLMKNHVGCCRENCDIATYAMRSLGIPIATDFYITSPSYNSRHFWSAIIDTTGIAVPFNYTEKPINRNSEYDRKMGKVYRNMFGMQKSKFIDPVPSDFPAVLVHPFTKDVSMEYFSKNSPLKVNSIICEKWMFLSIYNGKHYEAIDISPVTRGEACFKNIENGVIVFPTLCVKGRMSPCGYPVLTGTKEHHEFVPDTRIKNSIVIKRKYPIRNTLRFISNMIGGSLSVSNDNSFKNAVKLCEFKDTLQSNSIILDCDLAPVRYLRYTAPPEKNIEIAELHVFDKNGEEILFKNIRADHPVDDLHVRNFQLIYDNIWSSFYMSEKGESLIFDFGEMVDIGKILFVPRNDDNFVRKGHRYELFFHNGSEGWKTLGCKIAEADSLIYNNVPGNAVFWLHNHTDGIEERCFFEIDGKQQFI